MKFLELGYQLLFTTFFLSDFGRFVVWITCSVSTDEFHHFFPHKVKHTRHQKLPALRRQ
jgi:hypothetical protein